MRLGDLLRQRRGRALLAALGLVASTGILAVAAPATSGAATVAPKPVGNLDCNGMSPVQKTVTPDNACTDIRGATGIDNQNTWGGHFYDNGRYIGHDEPDVRYLSSVPNSGNDVTWTETLGKDPAAAPTVKTPGSDVTHYAELTIAPWFSMALCNPFSYPLLPCQPKSDVNAPASAAVPTPPGAYPGAGSSFLEMQFYPPGMAPFIDNVSCDNTHWCASLHINDAECTLNFASCNANCEEPTNFAFIQTNGVPTGPPSPQLADVATNTPNRSTLLMNPGDNLKIHIFDAPVPGHPGQNVLETSIADLTTGQSGFMQASAANGFMATSITDCSGTPFNYEPEYSTSAPLNITPWAALQVNVSTQFEIGHFEACTSLSKPSVVKIGRFRDKTWNTCAGPYENAAPGGDGANTVETSDAYCYPVGDTHRGQAPPNIVTGCLDDVTQNGDLDFDGSPYWPDWPNSTIPNTFPSTFLESQPTTGSGITYPSLQIQTDAALSMSTCNNFPTSTAGCSVPPPNGPGKFYPYWTLAANCQLEFGNMTNGNTFGGFAQYGVADPAVGYAQLLGPIQPNPCAT